MRLTQAVVGRYLGAIGAYDYDPAFAGHNPDSALELVVSGRRVVAHDDDVVALRFASPDGAALPHWHPGAHLDLHLPSGLRRQYSLCGDPADRTGYTIAVRLVADGGGGSREMHALAPGDRVTIRGPRNGFPFVPHGAALFVAGGIGVTPILAMVRQARALGMDWRFVYTGRTRAAMPFLDEIAAFESDRVLVRPDDEFGVPTAAELLEHAPAGGAVYCCGPAPMLDGVRAEFDRTESAALHFERFGPPPVRDGVPFEVQLVSTGDVLEVPADRSALDVIAEQRPDVAYSCRQGFCGTCRVRVLAGEPDHRDARLTDDERRESMLPCVSRCDGGRLVLDV
ncbi:PDR/VanB family oxidoreductase [Rhodococcus sp. HNM0569]|uniref:PDR/VanB family oxidoreductase n=1 Tax=Rhodococcus sp. HNM0569 TaxID=2716340 RepID=UPI00146F8DF6|nr:PDR/VanB family oxidoreductase [Rhodococcus sp. HNM0569]NLU84475.1 oxidoreductase [Rhodococcus sp. HNM0569]